MSTTTAHTDPQHQDAPLDPPLYPSTFNLHPSGGRCRPPKSFQAFNDALRYSSSKLDDMLHELDLSQDETQALLASHKFHSHRQLRTQLLAQQLTIAAQDHAQTAILRLVELSHSNHAAIARLACTQLLAYAHLTPTPPTPNDPHPLIAPAPSAPAPAPTPQTPPPPSPPFRIYNSEFSISPPTHSDQSPEIPTPAAPPPRLTPVARATATALTLGFLLGLLTFAFSASPALSALVPHCLSAFPSPPLCFPVSNPILPILPGSTFDPHKPSSSGTEKGTLVSSTQPTGQDGQPTPPISPSALSRRHFVSLLGLGSAAALLASCQDPSKTAPSPSSSIATPPHSNKAIVSAPDDYAPSVPIKPTTPPPVTVAPKNTYGILPRSMWTREGPNLRTIDPMDGVKMITFHHSGDPIPFWATDFGETAQHLEGVREYHRSRNFQDIGYHFAIDRVGRVWQLRSLKYQGQHVRYNNEHNIGVVVLGNFQLQSMTQAQKDKVRIFGLLLRKEYGLPISRVFTHQEIVSTECPGRNMQPYMVAIRKQRLI